VRLVEFMPISEIKATSTDFCEGSQRLSLMDKFELDNVSTAYESEFVEL
jgi:hypothetical protein